MAENNFTSLAAVSGAELAFLGDAYYTLLAREYLLKSGVSGSGELNRRILDFVTAHRQSAARKLVAPLLDEAETAIFKRGRNANPSTLPKGSTMSEYRDATGMEALFGALWLNGDTARASELFTAITKGEQNL